MVCPRHASRPSGSWLHLLRLATIHKSFSTHHSGHLPRLHTTTFSKLFISFATLTLFLELDSTALVLQYLLALSAIFRGFGLC